jgi:hypothetical protein
MKIHQGINKRLKISNPKKGKPKITHQSQGRGSKHLKTKQSNERRRRVSRKLDIKLNDNLKRLINNFSG